MEAGTGDSVFAPLYQVLKRRGVKFKFFHQVTGIHHRAEGRKPIERIVMARQASVTPAQEAKGGYDPLIDVKGLPCWPGTPRYEQLVEGEQLAREGINLESPYSSQSAVEEITLIRGQDFDQVILGISIGALPYLCGDLIRTSPRWKNMVDHVRTVKTQALQLWLKTTDQELGWALGGEPILSMTYDPQRLPNPLTTWGDLSHIAAHEDWPADQSPRNVAYFCSAMHDDVPLTPTDQGPMHDCQTMNQAAEDEKVRAESWTFINKHLGILWPQAVKSEIETGQTRFDQELLLDTRQGTSSESQPFGFQYWRANIYPSERYVLSVPGSDQYRLPANNPLEFPNLYLAGDWTDNGLNSGAMEAAVMAGRLAAHALSGYPHRKDIIGVDFGGVRASATSTP